MLGKVASVGGLTLASRVAGFVRDVVTAALLGAGPVADAFFVAFRLPNHFRALFAEGAFNAAFVPLFSKRHVEEGAAAAKRFAEQVLAVLLAVQLLLLVLFELAMPAFIHVFAPGFADDPVRFDLAVLFTRITFPYLLLISIVALLGGILNSLGRFSAAAAAPILLNLCLIAALLWLSPHVATPGHALAWGVLAAGLAQFALLAWAARRTGTALRLPLPRLTPGIRRFLKVLGPAALGAGVVQISLFVDTLIASLLPAGSVSFLYYADRINQLPLGVIGVAVGTVLLPELSRRLKAGDEDGAAFQQNRAIELSLTLTLPAAAAFLVAAGPIISALFQRGAFTAADSAASAAALTAYAIGLPAFVIVKSLLPGFYAREDTATPVRIAIAAVAVNIALKLALIGPFAHVGIALGTSAAAWVNAGLLGWTLHRRGLFRPDERLKRRLPRLLLAVAGMAAALVGAEMLLSPLFDGSAVQRGLALAALVGIGAAVFAGLALALGAVRPGDLRGLRRARG